MGVLVDFFLEVLAMSVAPSMVRGVGGGMGSIVNQKGEGRYE